MSASAPALGRVLRRWGRLLARPLRAARALPARTLRRARAARAAVAHARAQRRLERSAAGTAPRALGIGDWTFPRYSQAFVYREALALVDGGFDLRWIHSRAGRPDELAPSLARLAARGVLLEPDPALGRRELERYRRLFPERVASILARLVEASGLPEDLLVERADVGRAFAFASLAEAYRADYLHSWFFYEGALAAWVAAELLDLPRGLTAYADHRLADYPLKAVALHLASADPVVATSRRIGMELTALAPSLGGRLLVKPNTVDCALFAAPPRRAPADGEPLRLAAVSRVDPKKGLPVAVEAVARLRAGGVSVRLEHLGGADEGSRSGREEQERLSSRISALGLDEAIVLRGRGSEDEVRRLLAESHLFLAPAVETAEGDVDGIPTSLLEAMASGLPIVATTAGSIPEAIDDAVEGLLVAPGDAAALAGAISRLAAEPALATRLGASAAARARREFDAARREPELTARALERVRAARGLC